MPFSLGARQRNLERLRDEQFDLLVIGGGINGAGVARDAAMRGFRVALVEKGDFASGTSSKSSKLIHGGVRYLQQGDLRLVRVACRERDLLRRRLAPHLVEPLAFIFPVYRGDPVGFFTLGAGMWLYDLLAAFRNIRAHRMLTAKRTQRLEPALRGDRLRGAALYYDCWTDDARLTLETILSAHQEGAVVANYLELKTFSKEAGRMAGAVLQERFGAPPIEVRARCVVNTTGPWADQVRRIDDPRCTPCLRLTKGTHIIVPRARVGIVHAIVMHSPRDKRVLFAIPWGDHALIGTTDTDFDGSPDDVRPDEADFAYLLEAANWFFPAAHLRTDDIVSSYAGLRPLVADNEGKDPSAVSREEAIFESPSGLITLAGGKLTTYRLVAKDVVDLVAKRMGSGRVRCATHTNPLPGGFARDIDEIVKDIRESDGFSLTGEQIRRLARRYGSRSAEVIHLLEGDRDLEKPLVAGMPEIWAEAAYAACAEMAVQPDDILMRRTQIGLKDPVEATQVVEILKNRLNLLAPA
jgi:glycerol-3-phosphate dehydrogenase